MTSPLFQLSGEGTQKTILTFLLGIEEPMLSGLVRRVGRRLRFFRRRPVFVTDGTRLTVFREAGEIVEVLPSLTTVGRLPSLPWGDYLQMRRDMLSAKWRPEMILTYGTSFEEYARVASNPDID